MSNPGDLERNWYFVLGATPSDSLQELKQKYQRLVLMFHPDKQDPGLSEEEAGLQLQRFIDVDQAWKILSDEESRRQFDLQLRAQELKQRWPVDASITLEDMNRDSENECYSYSCRCGGEFLLENEDAEGDEDAVVCCDTCSLSIECYTAPGCTRNLDSVQLFVLFFSEQYGVPIPHPPFLPFQPQVIKGFEEFQKNKVTG